MNAIYPSINLCAQLAIVSELGPKQCCASFSACAVLAPSSGITVDISDCQETHFWSGSLFVSFFAQNYPFDTMTA